MTLQLQQAYAKIEEMRRRAEVVASGGDDSGESTAITTPQMEVRQGPSSAPKEEVDERRERDSSVEQLSIGSSETDF